MAVGTSCFIVIRGWRDAAGLDWFQSDSLPAMKCCNVVLCHGGRGVRFALVRKNDCVLPLAV